MAPPASRDPLRDEGTLDELIAALWEALDSDQSVACPVCGADMKPEYGAHARAVGGRCQDCGSTVR
jgi:DNA-directed RNA polymerase subunit RPC12/RpoP